MEEVKMDTAELEQFREYKRKVSLRMAEAQVSKIEYELLDASVGRDTLKKACQEARALKLGAICVHPNAVLPCVRLLGAQPPTSLIACISYPFGGDTTKIKVKAIKEAIKDGVDEVEVSVPVSVIKDGDWRYVKREFKAVKKASKKRAMRINVEYDYFTPSELNKICAVACDCGITCIKLAASYGKGVGGDVITAVKSAVKDKCTIKADGISQISDLETALGLGVDIIGSKNAPDVAQLVLKMSQQ